MEHTQKKLRGFSDMVSRTQIINSIIKKNHIETYLEIGVAENVNFRGVRSVLVKHSVDPNGKAKYNITSDEFFEQLGDKVKYQLIFIDGDHHEDQVDRDIQNSLDHLSRDGFIVLHDCNPPTEGHQSVPQQQQTWNGTVWKSIVKLRFNRKDLFVFVIDEDFGVGIIRFNKAKDSKLIEKYPMEKCLQYDFFDKHRQELLNLISYQGFFIMSNTFSVWEIKDNQIKTIAKVTKLGTNDKIPMSYLERGEYVVLRTLPALGDWAFLTPMPRLLKEKYPDCKVYLPSLEFLEKTLGFTKKQFATTWNNPLENVYKIFHNNPYVDGFKDEIDGVVYHDMYRSLDNQERIPLLERMLRFWRFEPEECLDSNPEIYFTEETKRIGDEIIEEIAGNQPYGYLMITGRFTYHDIYVHGIMAKLMEYDLPYFYDLPVDIEKTRFNFIDKLCEVDFNTFGDYEDMDIMVKLYIKANAEVNIGNQTGVTDCICRYSDVFVTPRFLHDCYLRGENYI